MEVRFNNFFNGIFFSFKENIPIQQKKIFLISVVIFAFLASGLVVIWNYLKTKKITVKEKFNISPKGQIEIRSPSSFHSKFLHEEDANANVSLKNAPISTNSAGSKQIAGGQATSKKEITEPTSPSQKLFKNKKNLNLSGSDLDDLKLKEILLSHPNIESLDLTFCTHLTNEAIHILKFLPSLKCLHLSSSSISYQVLMYLPKWLNSLHLECGDIGKNEIGDLPRDLRHLNLSLCEKVDQEALSLLPPDLISLNLRFCHGIPLNGFRNLPKHLTHLNLTECFIQDEDIQYLPLSLESLNLTDCERITNKAVKDFPRGLKTLNCTGCDFTNEGIKDLPRGLKILKLDVSHITDEGIAYLPPDIETLYISGPGITDKGITHLPPKLKSLVLINCEVTNAALLELPKHLVALEIQSCKKITNAGLSFLPKDISNLHLVHCNIGDSGLVHLNFLPKLLFLKLSCSSITKAGGSYLPRGIIGLTMIQSMMSISDFPEDLISLNLAFSQLRDDEIKNLPRKLKYLNLRGCKDLTDAMIPYLPKGLQSLDVSKCRFTEGAISQLRKAIPRVITSFRQKVRVGIYVPSVYPEDFF